jgi:hypothetical protein
MSNQIMKHKELILTRKEKIKLLQKIKEGKMSIEELQPPQIYIFIERILCREFMK